MHAKKLVLLAGSSRTASINKQLAKQATEIAIELGADATFVDLADFDMPIYNGDFEQAHSLPPAAIELKKLFQASDGFFIASPEYNSSFSPLLKNSLDWISRSHMENEAPLSAFAGKVAGLAAASFGQFGGLRGLVPLRMMLSNIQVTVVPQQLAVSQAGDKMTDGKYSDPKTLQMLRKVLNAMIKTTVT